MGTLGKKRWNTSVQWLLLLLLIIVFNTFWGMEGMPKIGEGANAASAIEGKKDASS